MTSEQQQEMVTALDGALAALLAVRRWDLDDGPCWCSVGPNDTNGNTHVEACRKARAATGFGEHR
jgi:hypothetical protein